METKQENSQILDDNKDSGGPMIGQGGRACVCIIYPGMNLPGSTPYVE